MDYYDNQTYYDILGVKRDASLSNIEAAKDRLKFGSPDDRVPFSMWVKIDEAYSVLSNHEKRMEYDKELEEKDSKKNNVDNLTTESQNTVILDTTTESSNRMPLPVPATSVEISKSNESSSPETLIEVSNEATHHVESSPTTPQYESINPDLRTESPEETSVEDNISMYDSDEDKQRIVNKYVLGTGRFGMLKVLNWEIYRYKLQEEYNSEKEISEIVTPDVQAIKEYNCNLDIQIDKFLSEPHNEYKLSISKIKYENQIKLLEKILEMRKLEYKNSTTLTHKLRVVAIKLQLASAKSRLNDITRIIDTYIEYSLSSRLTRLNKKLLKVNSEIDEQKEKGIKDTKKLEIKQSKLLDKRNNNASKVKIRLVRSWNMRDRFLYAKDFVKTFKYIPYTEDKINSMLDDNKVK